MHRIYIWKENVKMGNKGNKTVSSYTNIFPNKQDNIFISLQIQKKHYFLDDSNIYKCIYVDQQVRNSIAIILCIQEYSMKKKC